MLSHIVKPIPESLLDYVWDYGSLSLETEKKYITRMVESKNEFKNKWLVNLFVESVSLGQNSVRTLEGGDVSSVSLRDLSRTIKLFSFLRSFLEERKAPNQNIFEKLGKFSYWKYAENPLKDFEERSIRSIVLTISLCYLFRLCNKNSRSFFISKFSDLIRKYSKNLKFDKNYIQQIINDEQDDIIFRIKGIGKLPNDIACNKALKENIFTIMICLLTKIPLLICGKPGSSKTQSFKILKESMKGVSSEESLFSELPEIDELYYQGTLQSTSAGIKKLFQRAIQNAEDNQMNNILTVFFFDEIGLAEISANNPLKVLHDLLELPNLNVAFLGISNWTLDASKMNRAIYLARWDLDKEDLVEVSSHFTQNLLKEVEVPKKHKNLIELLPEIISETYLKFRELQQREFIHANFHGSRDFYSCIKHIFRNITSSSQNLFDIIKDSFERNFSGINSSDSESSSKVFKSIFIEVLKQNNSEYLQKEFVEIELNEHSKLEMSSFLEQPQKLDLVLSSLNDKKCRFLLLMTDSHYIEKIISTKIEQSRELFFLQGSNLKFDSLNDSLSVEILKEIKFWVEKGNTIVMKVKF